MGYLIKTKSNNKSRSEFTCTHPYGTSMAFKQDPSAPVLSMLQSTEHGRHDRESQRSG